MLLLIVAAGGGLYVAADPEQLEIDQAVRASAPGQFVRLSDGFTHYEIGGPADGRVVVLAAGISVPYYIWDPTFAALVQAGFRVLRYDYYGRGYSDRPDIAYSQDLYVRQLAELLDAVHITQPIDLAGLSTAGRWSRPLPTGSRIASGRWSTWIRHSAARTRSTVVQRMPRVWNYLTAIFEERWWADTPAGRFSAPGAVSRLARSLQGADAVSRLPSRAACPTVGHQCRRRSGAAAEAGRRASAAGARRSGARRTSRCPSSSA